MRWPQFSDFIPFRAILRSRASSWQNVSKVASMSLCSIFITLPIVVHIIKWAVKNLNDLVNFRNFSHELKRCNCCWICSYSVFICMTSSLASQVVVFLSYDINKPLVRNLYRRLFFAETWLINFRLWRLFGCVLFFVGQEICILLLVWHSGKSLSLNREGIVCLFLLWFVVTFWVFHSPYYLVITLCTIDLSHLVVGSTLPFFMD